jgi:hypothetical protein
MVSIGQQSSPWSYCTVSGKKRDITSLLGQMCPPAASLAASFREVGVVDGAVGPEVGVPLWQDAVSVMAVDVWGQALVTPMTHL